MIREVRQGDALIRLDLSCQVLSLDAPDRMTEGGGEPHLAPSPSPGALISASILAQKAKHFDDALYAVVELAAQRGHGKLPSKAEFLGRWADTVLEAGTNGHAVAVLLAACDLGRGSDSGAWPEAIARNVQNAVAEFLSDPRRSKPLGFYTDTCELTAIFQQDRMLMTELLASPSLDALRSALHGENLERVYSRLLSLGSRLTNPPAPGPANLLAPPGAEKYQIFAPSRSHEADLVMRLYGDRPIPDDFELAEALARAVEKGSISLAPRPDSGWYDHQAWALEPLLVPDQTKEADRLRFYARYREHLRDLFKGLLALTRETHIKQLYEPEVTCSALFEAPPRPKVIVRPDLSVEPLATHYRRRAESYRFVRGVLEDIFGPSWGTLRMPGGGSAERSVAEGLESMEALFHGASVRVCRELGCEPDPDLPGRSADRDDRSYLEWTESIGLDPDIGRDSRMMVPVFYDLERGKMKVWAMLGWSTRPIEIDFSRPPKVLSGVKPTLGSGLLGRGHRKASEDSRQPEPEVVFEPVVHQVAYPVTVELYVDEVLDRESFRRLCDRHKTRPEIIGAIDPKAAKGSAEAESKLDPFPIRSDPEPDMSPWSKPPKYSKEYLERPGFLLKRWVVPLSRDPEKKQAEVRNALYIGVFSGKPFENLEGFASFATNIGSLTNSWYAGQDLQAAYEGYFPTGVADYAVRDVLAKAKTYEGSLRAWAVSSGIRVDPSQISEDLEGSMRWIGDQDQFSLFGEGCDYYFEAFTTNSTGILGALLDTNKRKQGDKDKAQDDWWSQMRDRLLEP